MKHLENHVFILLSHIITLLGIQFIDLSLLSIICILVTVLYLLNARFLRKKFILNYVVQLILFSLIPFCYSTENLLTYVTIHPVSLINVVLIFVVFYVAYKITRTRKESYINVRNKYTEEKKNLKKANMFASRCLYFIILPLFLLIFYFNWVLKLVITLGLLISVVIIIYVYTIIMGRKQKLVKTEVN